MEGDNLVLEPVKPKKNAARYVVDFGKWADRKDMKMNLEEAKIERVNKVLTYWN